jgi:hypothetical protein
VRNRNFFKSRSLVSKMKILKKFRTNSKKFATSRMRNAFRILETNQGWQFWRVKSFSKRSVRKIFDFRLPNGKLQELRWSKN